MNGAYEMGSGVDQPETIGTGRKHGAYKGVMRTNSIMTFADRLGVWRMRWALGRMRYIVAPGLYALGHPNRESEVYVSANYKMSFDKLRSNLAGRDAWILVLDTKGINVWCAAGKGTFGTDEIVRRVESTDLTDIVSHRRLIVPQLGAPGVSAHEVKKRTGFQVVYGPVRAEDLPAFIDAGMSATPEMRRVRFTFFDRVALIPVEIIMSAGYLAVIIAAIFLLAGLGPGGYSEQRALATGPINILFLLGAYLAGTVLTPALLPALPGRAFATKGVWAGVLLLVIVSMATSRHDPLFDSGFTAVAWLMLVPVVSSFLAMNFTGASTYTSLSGVRKEMRIAVPLQVIGSLVGVVLWVIGRFA